METQSHWENVYKNKKADEVSWFQPHLTKSLELIRETGIDKKARIVDVGGGASTLADDLLQEGYSGLDVMRYSPEILSQELGNDFTLLKSFDECHQTPFGTSQNFVYCLFKKR